MKQLTCRFCSTSLEHICLDLGMSPFSNSYLTSRQLLDMETFYPLRVYVCHRCYLVQLPTFKPSEEIFSDYAYFSSYSDSWLAHCRKFAQCATDRFKLTAQSQVIEIASNDGYLLQYFQGLGVPVLGIEPAENVAEVAIQAGVDTHVAFFGRRLAMQLKEDKKQADLLIGNNVLAHVPDLNDFVAGLKVLLSAEGIVTIEFPHLMRLMEQNQFDTIYHEHFSYFSLMTVLRIFEAHGLTVFDVDELPTHGGSLRIYAVHSENEVFGVTSRVPALLQKEIAFGLGRLACYQAFSHQVHTTKRQILEFFVTCKKEGKKVAGYGAPAKGNTLLNYCGIREDLLPYTVDRSPHKQGRFLPGTHIPIYPVNEIEVRRPDYLLILPWNIKDEIMAQMANIGQWGGQFVLPIPEVTITKAIPEQ